MTKIEWTNKTWNPIVGCTRVSQGCTNCYAEKMAWRLKSMGVKHYADTIEKIGQEPRWTGELALAPHNTLEKPLRTKKPTKFFVNSMGDLFHENVPFEWVDKVFAIMALAPQHTFQILTKRPERMREYIAQGEDRVHEFIGEIPYMDYWDIKHVIRAGGTFEPEEREYFSDCSLVSNRAYCQLENLKWPLQNVWLGVSVENQETANERKN